MNPLCSFDESEMILSTARNGVVRVHTHVGKGIPENCVFVELNP